MTYGGYFEAFLKTLDEQTVEKIQYGLLMLKTQNRISKKFVKCLVDDLYELRTEYNGNTYRIFFVFDEGQLIILLSGFKKKSQKTPKKEINRAIMIKEAYYAQKRQQNKKLR